MMMLMMAIIMDDGDNVTGNYYMFLNPNNQTLDQIVCAFNK